MTQSILNNADQFKQSFREEAREIVVDLEAALLELNEHRADMELVGPVFRALHTIKGSGSMFGFEKLAAFTHNLETAFDQVRNGTLDISSELVDLTLAALDQIRSMVEENPDAPADCAACDAILSGVRRLRASPYKWKLRPRSAPHFHPPPFSAATTATLLPKSPSGISASLLAPISC